MYLLKDELSVRKARKREEKTKSKRNQTNILFAELNLWKSTYKHTEYSKIRRYFPFYPFEISRDVVIYIFYLCCFLKNNIYIFEK